MTKKTENFLDNVRLESEALLRHIRETSDGLLETTSRPSTIQPSAPLSVFASQHIISPGWASAAANDALRQRQVFINMPKEVLEAELASLTEEDLLEKARVTLVRMGLEGKDRPKDMEDAFRSVKRKPNGGLLYELTSADAAAWLRQDDVQKSFARHFCPDASV